MSTAQKTLIEAVQRIALNPEALASRLGELQKRGVIDGIKTTLGGYNELQDDCCTEGDGTPEEPEDKEPIDEDAPPEVPDIGDEDGDGESEWSDCETGDPITFTPGGFPQPETCKECRSPDPDWAEGYYWRGNLDLAGQSFASPSLAYAAWPRNKTRYIVRIRPGTTTTLEVIVYYELGVGVPGGYTARIAQRFNCPNTPTPGSDIESSCSVTEAPLIDQCVNWDADNTTSYTLANGCIVASTCDPDASSAAQACNECITICNADGQERRICSIGNGQWILYDPTGQFKGGRYDATGKRLEILDKGETGGYLPSEQVPEDSGGYDGGTIGGGDGWVWS